MQSVTGNVEEKKYIVTGILCQVDDIKKRDNVQFFFLSGAFVAHRRDGHP